MGRMAGLCVAEELICIGGDPNLVPKVFLPRPDGGAGKRN
jgi:hypothetical protein